MRPLTLLVLVLAIVHGLSEEMEPPGKIFKRLGNITIGGLFPLHVDGSSEGKQCGKIKMDQGVQRMEAMLYAVDKINREQILLPGLSLGMHILDTCSQDTHALEQTLEFIKTAISTNNAIQYECQDGTFPMFKKHNPTVAVIGAASSQVSAMVANMLRLFKVSESSLFHSQRTQTPCISLPL